ncbi:hypothetical protein TWF281_004530 [Arthrobotrys megalospora]
METTAATTAPYLPLEIQYQILESADWLQQSTLRQVCKAWESFIKDSSKLFGDRYTELPPLIGLELERSCLPQLHCVVGYRSGFVRSGSLGGGFVPCVLHRDDAGKVIGSSPETDLSLYFADPLLKPKTVPKIQGLFALLRSSKGRNKFYTKWGLRDVTTVESYLQNTSYMLDHVLDISSDGGSISEVARYYKMWLSVARISHDGVAGLIMVVQAEREADSMQE